MGFFTPVSCVLMLAVSGWILVAIPAQAQRSVPVSNTVQFAAALANVGVSEIILDPSGTGVRLPHNLDATFATGKYFHVIHAVDLQMVCFCLLDLGYVCTIFRVAGEP